MPFLDRVVSNASILRWRSYTIFCAIDHAALNFLECSQTIALLLDQQRTGTSLNLYS